MVPDGPQMVPKTDNFFECIRGFEPALLDKWTLKIVLWLLPDWYQVPERRRRRGDCETPTGRLRNVGEKPNGPTAKRLRNDGETRRRADEGDDKTNDPEWDTLRLIGLDPCIGSSVVGAKMKEKTTF